MRATLQVINGLPVETSLLDYLSGMRLLGTTALVTCPRGHGILSSNAKLCPMCGAGAVMQWFAPFTPAPAYVPAARRPQPR